MRNPHDVVLHEFAHQLDQQDGSADGVPILESRSSYTSWARIVGTEHQRLQDLVHRHRGLLQAPQTPPARQARPLRRAQDLLQGRSGPVGLTSGKLPGMLHCGNLADCLPVEGDL